MWSKIIKIFCIVLTLFLVGYGGFLIYDKYFQKGDGFNNFPGPLSGPRRSQRAARLDIKEIIKWTNYYRSQNGVTGLTENATLDKVAEEKAQDMFLRQYFAHVSLSGEGAADLVKNAGYAYKSVGENLALGDFQNEKDLVDAWMNSEGHRKNILNSGFKEIGVSALLNVYEKSTTWISVQEFGTQMPNCPSPSSDLKKQIDSKKALNDEATLLYEEGKSLIEAGNAKVAEANQTHDESLYQEGFSLQSQGQEKINQAKAKQQQASDLSSLVSQYNTQVQNYNKCLAQ